MSGKNVKRVKDKGSLASRVIELIETARQRVAAVANVAQVYTNYEIGRQIVEEEQGGKEREATERNWSFRQLERMYRTSTFERLHISKDSLIMRLLSLLGVLEYGRLAA